MAEIVHLSQIRDQVAVREGFAMWRRRFGGRYEADTCLADLSPPILCRLSEPGDESTDALNALIIGFSGYGKGVGFDDLDPHLQMAVVDMHLFLADQIRFEMMQRMGWLAQFSCSRVPLLEMVRDFDRVKAICQHRPPRLASDHPGYEEYKTLVERDQQVFIRRLVPSALEHFKKAFCNG